MDEIRDVIELEKKEYDLRIYSDRLLGLTTQCSVDGAWSRATGEMYFNKVLTSWVVEYLCPLDGEIFRQWTREVDALTKEIANDVLGQESAEGK